MPYRDCRGEAAPQTVRPGATAKPRAPRLGAHARGTKTGAHGAGAQTFSAARERAWPSEARLQAKDAPASGERRTRRPRTPRPRGRDGHAGQGCPDLGRETDTQAKDAPASGERRTCRPRTPRPRGRDGHAGQGRPGLGGETDTQAKDAPASGERRTRRPRHGGPGAGGRLQPLPTAPENAFKKTMREGPEPIQIFCKTAAWRGRVIPSKRKKKPLDSQGREKEYACGGRKMY